MHKEDNNTAGEIQSYIQLCVAGDLETLSTKLSQKELLERKSIVNTIIDGATCLTSSCRHGHLSLADFLVDACGADLELTAAVDFDGESIEGASPLWCASAAGHLDVTEFLLDKGAEINRTTHTNSTPLRGACFDGHFDVVRLLVARGADIEIANRHGHTCLMISSYKGHSEIVRFLLESGADCDRSSAKGNTAMHDAAESGSLSVIRLLLARGAKMQHDLQGLSPVMTAANCGHANVVDFLVKSDRLVPDAEERAAAMELLACALVDRKNDWSSAVRRWRRSLVMRERFRIPKRIVETARDVFNGSQEFQTVEDLQQLVTDPEQMWQQSLIVRERVLGPAHPDTMYYLRYRGAVYADQRQFDSCLRLWLHALQLHRAHSPPHSPSVLACFGNFVELFGCMLEDKAKYDYSVLQLVLVQCLQELRRSLSCLSSCSSAASVTDRSLQFTHRLMRRSVSLTSLACRSCLGLSESASAALYSAIRCRSPLTGCTLLHLACSLPCQTAAKKILRLGADIDAVNDAGETPLHACVAAGGVEAAEMLLNAGAHVDSVDNCGRTAANLLESAAKCEKEESAKLRRLLASPTRRSLACRCASALASVEWGDLCEMMERNGAQHLLRDLQMHRGCAIY